MKFFSKTLDKKFENEVTLPLNTKMSDEDVDYVIENFVEVVKGMYRA